VAQLKDDEHWQGQWQGQLRAKGYRLTPQRQLVLEAIAVLGHATPEEIIAQVREVASGVNISTVYRTLDLLEELALVTHTHLGHGAPTYHIAEDAEHVHLVCRSCGGIAEVSPDVVTPTVELLAAEHGFETDVHHFAIFGRCAACRERP
jgi:Fur family transcriptional regulator, ferric uptake regulator